MLLGGELVYSWGLQLLVSSELVLAGGGMWAWPGSGRCRERGGGCCWARAAVCWLFWLLVVVERLKLCLL